MNETEETLHWWSDLKAYLDRRMLIILLLGFSSGLPYALSFITLSVWLREVGVSRAEIGLFSLVGLPYALKLFWAPLIDRLRLPWLTARLGQRRSWALVAQFGLMASIVFLGSLDPAESLSLMAVAALVVVFMAASQDIVVDAYRIEILQDEEQALGGAMTQYGYRIGMLASGAGALLLADRMPWSWVYSIEAALLIVGVLTILRIPEPEAASREQAWIVGETSTTAGVGEIWRATKRIYLPPFRDFLGRRLWLPTLIFVVFYRFPDSFLSIMANVFYIDLGFTKTDIGIVSKSFGLVATLFGIFVGGLVVHRIGIMRGLLVCGVVQMLSNLMYVALAQTGASMPVFAATIAIENVSSGMGSAAFVGYLSSLCSAGFSGTQYAMLSSIGLLPRNVLSSLSGFLADALTSSLGEVAGWTWFFIASTAMGMPGLLLLLWLMRKLGPEPAPLSRHASGPGL